MSLQAKLQAGSAEFQKLQIDLSRAVEARQKLDAQLSENELVKKEFAQLKPENAVYKLIGPVLVKQDQVEAKTNVETRLDFIRSEIRRVESQIKDIEGKQEKKKSEVRNSRCPARRGFQYLHQLVQMQAALQQQAQQAATSSGP
ncbi:Prefoldin [Panaeolus papilionaceus]|nr:Prefoldin [Panaeolus papilionaceus]